VDCWTECPYSNLWQPEGVVTRKRAVYSLAASVALLTLLVYLPTLQNGFIELDDVTYVLDNPHIRSFNGNLFRWAFFQFYDANWFPLTWISHAVDYAFWGLNPLGHHLTNIILHSINTLVVVLLVVRLLEVAKDRAVEIGSRGFLSDRTVLLTAGVTGLLFGIHPVHVESVAWVSERKDLLCALFFLLSIMAYTKYAGSRQWVEGRQRSANSANTSVVQGNLFIHKYYLLSLVLYILSLMSKPMAVTLPIVLLILDWYPLNRIQSHKALRGAIVEKIPFLVLSLLSSIVTMIAQQTGGAMKMMAVVPLSTRVFVAMQSLVAYLEKMLLPLNLIPFYPYPKDVSLYSLKYSSAIILSFGITGVCTVIARKQKFWLTVWGYYVITLVPVLGLIQVGEQSMADRYTYLPSLGPFLIAGLGAAWIAKRSWFVGRGEAIALLLTVSLMVPIGVLLSYATVHQVSLWGNGIKLWSAVIEREPTRVPFAYLLRGRAFEKDGQVDRAVADYTKAITLNPKFTEAYNNLGMIYGKARIYDQAIEIFSKSISLDPKHATSFNNRGRTYIYLGQYEKALEDLNRAIALNHDLDVAYVNRGELYYRTGEMALAREDYRKACDLGNEIGCSAFRRITQGSYPE
jgi:Tfp pilus assembly protein PilF